VAQCLLVLYKNSFMKWLGGRESDNVEEGSSSGIGAGHIVGGGLGTLVIGIIIYLLGGNPSEVLQPTQQQYQQETTHTAHGSDRATHFVKVVLAETEDVWSSLFKEMGKEYQPPILHLYTNYVESACGMASSATGPFYCPADEKVYLDRTFFIELKQRFDAPGDFANAYVIAHEVGHHVQHLLGTTDKVERLRRGASKKESNRYSVMLELQADFYAGVWAHYIKETDKVVEEGDIEAALNAANAIGDDRLQKQTQGRVVPDAFTHGTSEQRMYWFKKGYETGDIKQGNTFKEMGGV
jgi:uncharacterized protein